MRQPIIHFPKGYKFATQQELEEAYLERNQILVEGQIEIAELQDKLSRRNMQIKDLKKRIEELIASYEAHCPEAKDWSNAIRLAKEVINH